MKIFLSLIFLFVCSFAMAGNEVGNGGGVLYNLQTKRPYMFFDAYESEVRYGYSVKWPSERENEIKVAMSFTERLSHFDADLQKQLNKWILSFYSESVYSQKDLPVIFDMGTGISIPNWAGLGQLVIQMKQGQGQVRYILNKRYWVSLPAEQKGIAILHEVIYRKALEVNPRLFSSVKVRMFVAFLISNEISYFSQSEYSELLKSLELKKTNHF